MTSPGRLDALVGRVVSAGNCSGCGYCSSLDRSLDMRIDSAGFARPVRPAGVESTLDAASDAHAAAQFSAACPGMRVDAVHTAGATRHPTMGPVMESWQAHATDPEIRHRGSSGGVITAMNAWLVETGRSPAVVAAASDSAEPRRTVSVRITTRDEAIAAAGSRYAPVSQAGVARARDDTLVGKPCEASAVRAAHRDDPASAPLIISFFCAGTSSQESTDSLVSALGIEAGAPLSALWYRGRGWPGDFTATATDGRSVATTYDDSWGAHLGKALQWRCKICPDGVGESSDITAADFWKTDASGYPDFTEGDGVSALIARTERGRDLIRAAIAAGVIAAEALDIDALARIQPLQVSRRTVLLGRIWGARLGGMTVPSFQGFGLLSLARTRPRSVVQAAKGTARRALARRLKLR